MVLPNGAAIKMSIRYFEFQHFLRDFLVGSDGPPLSGGREITLDFFSSHG